MLNFRETVALVALVPLTMVLVFSLLACAGLVTSDPAGKHPVTAAEMWGIR